MTHARRAIALKVVLSSRPAPGFDVSSDVKLSVRHQLSRPSGSGPEPLGHL